VRFLVYAACLVLALLAAGALRWAAEHYREAPRPPGVFDDPRLSFHRAAHLARTAVRRYRALPPYERRALNEALRASLVGLPRWSRELQARARTLCLGERHDAVSRAFLATRVLPRLDYRTLMLETGARALTRLLSAHGRGEPVSLLDAPVGGVLADALARRPPARLVAIDEPAAAGARGAAPREERLVAALAGRWRQEERTVVIFGALHCRDLPGWMYHELARTHPRIADAGMHGSVMLARYREPGAQILFYLLEEMGFEGPVLAVADVRRFPRQVQDWLPPTADALAGYQSALLFDERALGLEPAPSAGR